MEISRISIDNKEQYLKNLGVDGGGIEILSSKMQLFTIEIKALHVGGANILKQDALSIGADLAVPRGTILSTTPYVDCLLIGTKKHLKILSKKELSQPFGLKNVAKKLSTILDIKAPTSTKIMGIINANDDSFYKESRFNGRNAIEKIISMIEDGADIIDIGGVSSRPNAPIVSLKDELSRVTPIIDFIKKERLYERAKFSIDSYQPSVINYALESGFDIVNDITGLRDIEVVQLCATYKATAIIMHMQGTPQTMQNSPTYSSVVSEIYSFLEDAKNRATSEGVKDVIIDVGIGFGKTLQENITLIKNLEHFLTIDSPILVGASRKSMIDMIVKAPIDERLAGTITLHLESIKNGASILRVHDVKEHFQALKVFEAMRD